MIEIGSRWHRAGYRTIWTVLGWAPRARGGPNGDEPVLRLQSHAGSLGYVHPRALKRYYRQVPPECQDPIAIGEHAPPVER